MEYRVELAARATQDMRDIFDYIGAGQSLQAEAWFNGIEATMARLDQSPGRGSVTPEAPHLREIGYGRRPNLYRIIYRIDTQNRIVTILHIRHGARDRFPPEIGT